MSIKFFFRKILFNLSFKIYVKDRFDKEFIEKSSIPIPSFIKTHYFYNESFNFIHAGHVGKKWYESGNEIIFLKKYSKFVKKGDVVIDIGAHQGFFSLIYRIMTGKNGVVYSVEPFDYLCDVIRFNASLNKFNNIIVINAGIGDFSGIESISPLPTFADEKIKNKFSKHIVSIKLDDLAILNPDYIKIDIEGFEIEAFRHAGEIFKKRPIFHISIHPKFIEAKKTNYMEIFSTLDNAGYLIGDINNEGKFFEIDRKIIFEKGFNILAIHKEKFDKIFNSI